MSDEGKSITGVAIIVGLFLSLWILASKMEATAFNRATGKNITTWQAMWVALRVQEQAKE